MDYDVCIVGSGAGAGPVAYTLANQGYKVLVLEKGGWFGEKDFTKDEIAVCRRNSFTPHLADEPQVIEEADDRGDWKAESNGDSGWDFWNGSMVGGSSNLMSGFFHRMKPVDFHLKSEFGTEAGDNTVDWPISYDDMESYFMRTELVVGVSGKVVPHPFLEPRSTPDYPYPPLAEHVISRLIDKSSENLGYHAIPMARAILSRPHASRQACSYSGYCGSYGCTTGAKGSSRAALLNVAVSTGNCEIRPHSHVYKLVSDSSGKISKLKYFDGNSRRQSVDAKIYVLACQAVETSRLLLLSAGPKFPDGLANNNGQVGRNLIFSAGGIGSGIFDSGQFSLELFRELQDIHLFVNRALQDWYIIDDRESGRIKGGTIDFLMAHANPIRKATSEKWKKGKLQWGTELKRALEYKFRHQVKLNFEIFCDWTPTDNCFVTLDSKVKDKYGLPVARIRIGSHPRDLIPGNFLASKAEKLLADMGMKHIRSDISNLPPANLMAGGCRFGSDPATSVLDKDCRAHEVENLFVTDGSFMPTGGSTTYTWTIYANAFRVAEKIAAQL
jgi:choline dehydrogenase-like flavoprotein